MMKVHLIDEHREAFGVWNRAVAKGRLSPSGNVLLHVDEHADLSTPLLETSPREAQEAYQGLLHHRFEELSVIFDWSKAAV